MDFSMDMKAKANEIHLVLSEPDVNLWKLRELALTEGGLVNDNLRKRAWPKLVGLHDFYVETKPREKGNVPPRPAAQSARPPLRPRPTVAPHGSLFDDDSSICSSLSFDLYESSGQSFPSCLDSEQIDRDVARCTWHLLTGSQRVTRFKMENKHRKRVASALKRKQRRLGRLVNLTLLRTYEEFDGETLFYYQGYHDVASIFLSTLGGGGSSPSSVGSDSVAGIAASIGLDLPSAVLSRVSSTHFRDAMRSSFMQLQTAIRLLLMPLINYFDREVHEFLLDCDMEPFFALSWIITWFSHDIRDTALVKRLFDAFIVSHPLLPLYMTVAMVCHANNRAELLAADCDFAIVHSTLSALPKNSSMVGWKYRPAEGYTSGDETDDEINTSSMEVSLLIEQHYSLECRDDEGSETHSLISSQISVGSKGTKVPFQELLDNALGFMRRVPPRKLIHLSKMYFSESTLQPMLDLTPSIQFLNPHPKWGLVSTAPADWVLKQRARRRHRDGRGLTRRDRRNRVGSSRSRSREPVDASNCKENFVVLSEDEAIEKFLRQNKRMLAVIACGFGAGDEDDILERKRRRLLLGYVTIGVVIIAVTVMAFAGEERKSREPQHLQAGIDAATCEKVNASEKLSAISVSYSLTKAKSRASRVSSGARDVPVRFELVPLRLRGQSKVSFDEVSSIVKSAAKRITVKEASLLVEPHSTILSMKQRLPSVIIDVGDPSTAPLGIEHSVALSSSEQGSFVDRILTVLPCPKFWRFFMSYTNLTSKKVPKVFRKIALFLRPIFKSFGKTRIEQVDL